MKLSKEKEKKNNFAGFFWYQKNFTNFQKIFKKYHLGELHK